MPDRLLVCTIGGSRIEGYRAFVSIWPQRQSGHLVTALIDTGAPFSILPAAFVSQCASAKPIGIRGSSTIGVIRFEYYVAEVEVFCTDGVDFVPVTLRAKIVTRGIHVRTGRPKSAPAILGLHAFLPKGELLIEAVSSKQADWRSYLRLSGDLMKD